MGSPLGKRGFTLIELLVVIAIIAVLAAILFPIFIGAKARAVEAKCASNLKQIGYATAMYVDDYHGRYHPYGPYAWVALIQKYSKTKLLSRCPADLDQPKEYADYWKNVYTDYWSGYLQIPPPLETVIVHKKTTVYMMDGPPNGNGHHTWWGPPTTWVNDTLCKNAERRHNGGFNVLFCDWHLKHLKPGSFKSTRANTGASNPLKGSEFNAYAGLRPVPPWDNMNDGTNPWFRGD